MYNSKRVADLEARLLKVIGKVQRVGFRRYALDLAQELGLAGHVKNLPDGSVQIFVQGGKEKLLKFLELLKSPPLGKVRKVKVEEVPVDPNIKEFRIIYGELGEELQEGFGAMQTVFMAYWDEFRDYREEFRSFRDEFRDYRNEFRSFRDEFRDYREEFGSFRDEFREFAKRTDENFKLIMEKYGEISEKLTMILETLIKESNETRKMLNESMKALREALDRLPKR
ncbi:MAG: hypothetical protein DRO05_07175 [Thermoproteota archaeon]|nr:MAG: hypothetical protein DRO05_07175 [Candidatus Korarchaeota archaeon]